MRGIISESSFLDRIFTSKRFDVRDKDYIR